MFRGIFLIGLGCLLLIAPTLSAQTAARRQFFKSYESDYYIIQTDLPPEAAREAAIRMTKMAEEYHRRTREFSGVITRKFPFILCSRQDDYIAAGGIPGSAGVYTGDTLMALADRSLDATLWHTIQHEGFHQFADAVIRGDLPIWVDEGLAEYFGEAVFTGDGFVAGVIPQRRLERIRNAINGNQYRPIAQMMLLSHRQWNNELDYRNYDQAWSMVQFLAHAEDGRYQAAFVNFMRAVGSGQPWGDAWVKFLGPPDAFERQWRAYWLGLPDNPTAQQFVEANVATYTSFLARAMTARQTFASWSQFQSAAQSKELTIPDIDWLPASLLDEALARNDDSTYELLQVGARSYIVAILPDRTRLVGSYTVRNRKVSAVTVQVDTLHATIEQARSMAATGKRAEGRAILLAAIRQNANSPYIAEARQVAEEMK